MIDIDHNQLNQIELRDLLVTSDKVAHVQVGNNLEHALLVLTKTGYTSIPVLNPRFQLQGFVSMTLILDSILGLKRIEFERLETMKVEEVMNTKKFVKVIKKAVHHSPERVISIIFLRNRVSAYLSPFFSYMIKVK